MARPLRSNAATVLAVAVPVVAVIAVTIAAVVSLARVRIGGDAYQEISRQQELLDDARPPSLYLVEADLAAHRLAAVAADRTTVDQVPVVEQALTDLETAYNNRVEYWQQRMLEGEPVAMQLFDLVDVDGQLFWRIFHSDLLPAVDNLEASLAPTGTTAAPSAAQLASQRTAVSNALEQLHATFSSHRDAVRDLDALVTENIRARETAARQDVDLALRLVLLVAAAGMVASAAVGVIVLRATNRPLRTLTAALDEAVATDLPELRSRARDVADGAEPPTVEPLEIPGLHSGPAVDALAAGIDALRVAVVDATVEAARNRRQTATALAEVGRRNQALLNRTLQYLTVLEQRERDPEALESLLRLDHLVTRIRRNAESLLVVATSSSTRDWTEPVDMVEIVRGALSEIEAYDRVSVSDLEPAHVEGSAAGDLSHILAELLENATTFSPPAAWVDVVGYHAEDGYVLTVTDSGIGMTAAELTTANEVLGGTVAFDPSQSTALGLHVAGRLGLRHGIDVRLHPADRGGVVAAVCLPDPLLAFDGEEALALPLPAAPTGPPPALAPPVPLAADPGPDDRRTHPGDHLHPGAGSDVPSFAEDGPVPGPLETADRTDEGPGSLEPVHPLPVVTEVWFDDGTDGGDAGVHDGAYVDEPERPVLSLFAPDDALEAARIETLDHDEPCYGGPCYGEGGYGEDDSWADDTDAGADPPVVGVFAGTDADPAGTYPFETYAGEVYPSDSYPSNGYPSEIYPAETSPGAVDAGVDVAPAGPGTPAGRRLPDDVRAALSSLQRGRLLAAQNLDGDLTSGAGQP